jgi:xanthine/CO dehydrogenase XdhC/CoxF family maturation factor
MDYALGELCRFFRKASSRGDSLVMASILRTEASTYRKAGARILIAAGGEASGMLSGGCLEADLREHMTLVLASASPKRIWFDTRESDDPIWGLGMGCEGAMDVWLQPVTTANDYGMLEYLDACLQTEQEGSVATVVGGQAGGAELGRHGYPGMKRPDALASLLAECTATHAALRCISYEGREIEVFVAPAGLPPRLLICGAGPDAVPVQAFAAALGWRVTIYDHRPAYAIAERFPLAARVVLGRPEELARHLQPATFNAAVIMSHHLASDISYLKLLAAAPPAYIGLLGPPGRRQRVLQEIGSDLQGIAASLHGPAGLDIGAGTPESIALSIVAQIHAALSGRSGGSFAALKAGPAA